MTTWRVVRGASVHYQCVERPDVIVHAEQHRVTGEYTYMLLTSNGVSDLLSHTLYAALGEAVSISRTEDVVDNS